MSFTSFSRWSSRLRDQTLVSCIGRWVLYYGATWKVYKHHTNTVHVKMILFVVCAVDHSSLWLRAMCIKYFKRQRQLFLNKIINVFSKILKVLNYSHVKTDLSLLPIHNCFSPSVGLLSLNINIIIQITPLEKSYILWYKVINLLLESWNMLYNWGESISVLLYLTDSTQLFYVRHIIFQVSNIQETF